MLRRDVVDLDEIPIFYFFITASVWKSGLLPFLVYFWARTLPSKFPIIIEVLEHKILGLVRLISGLLTGNFSFSGTPVSMKKLNGNVPAAKLPKKAKDRTFKHYSGSRPLYVHWCPVTTISGAQIFALYPENVPPQYFMRWTTRLTSWKCSHTKRRIPGFSGMVSA